jgi:lysophospholipase L1-like esterase
MRNFLAGMALRTLLLAPLLLRPSPGWSQAGELGDRQAFRDFLAQAKNNGSAETEKVAAFYRTTGAFWRAHWLDYSQHPENYADVMALYRADQAVYPRAQQARDPERYRKDIELFKEFDSKNAPPKNPALFVGSSTIMKWKTADAFPGFSVINRGFGGSVLGDVLYFYKDVIGKYHPSAVLLYCDNDVTGGGNPDQAFEKVMQIYAQVRSDFPKVPFVFLSMKHAPNSAFADPAEPAAIDRFNDLAKAVSRKDPGFKYFDMDAPVLDANGKVQPDLFLDGEHFNDKGYALINPAMQKFLISLHAGSPPSGSPQIPR